MDVIREIRTDIYHLKLRSDGILHIHVDTNRPETINDLKELFKCMRQISDDGRLPVLFTFEKYVYVNKEVNEYWANDQTVARNIKAEAFVASSLTQKMMGKLYLEESKTNRPVNMFSNESEAIEWLKGFL